MNEWITDRLPTEEDVNSCDFVIIPCDEDYDGWVAEDFTKVKTGEPWAPYPTMPPYKSDEHVARESMPDGYRFVGKGNWEKPLFEWGEKSIRWRNLDGWSIEMDWSGSSPECFYAVREEPEEPDLEFWSCPEDIPENALWFVDYDGDCDMIQTVTHWGFVLAQNIKIRFDDLAKWRWSDRPFSRFEDGKLCVKGGSDD